MSSDQLAGPGGARMPILEGGIGGESKPSDRSFFMRVEDSIFRYFVAKADSTGDGDTEVKKTGSRLLDGAVSLTGWMIASQALGIKNLKNPAKNPVTFTFQLAAKRQLQETVLVTQIDIHWSRSVGEFVGVAIVGGLTHTVTDDLEPDVTR